MIRLLRFLTLAVVLLWSPVDAWAEPQEFQVAVVMAGSGEGIGAGGAVMPEAPPFAAVAVDFDGINDNLTRGQALTGQTDTKTGALSVWVRIDQDTANNREIISVPGIFAIRLSSTDKFLIVGNAAGPVQHLSLSSSTSYTSGWHHLLIGWNLATPEVDMWIDDSEDAGSLTELSDGTIDYSTVAEFGIGGDEAGTDRFDGCFADLWFDETAFIDFAVQANRRKFIDGAGKPEDLGATGNLPTGSQPILYLNQNTTAAWHTQAGSGGGFTEVGALTDCSTSPSD